MIRYLPWFALYDPYVTRELTVRDLLVHRSGFGLGAGDLLWWPPTTYGREEIARRLRFIRPATSFRSAYAYDNVLYLVAGEVIEAVSGQSWEEFVRTRILDRLGMAHSDVRHSAVDEPGNVATPARGGGRHGAPGGAVPERQRQSGRGHRLGRGGHGEVDAGAARLGPGGGRIAPVLSARRPASSGGR